MLWMKVFSPGKFYLGMFLYFYKFVCRINQIRLGKLNKINLCVMLHKLVSIEHMRLM